MLWNFHISGDIYYGTDYFMTARSMSVRNAHRENPTIKRAIVNETDVYKRQVLFRPPLLILCITGARTAWEVSRFREM